MMNYAIETHHLKKVYKDKIVVNAVNIHVKKGEIYGFVGPNGAGKSTLMKMLLNLVQANSGEIVIFGNKVIESDFEILKRIEGATIPTLQMTCPVNICCQKVCRHTT